MHVSPSLIIGILVLVVGVVWIVNHLSTLAKQIKCSFSLLDVQLQRRYDLIPNLLESVKDSMQRELSNLKKAEREAKSRGDYELAARFKVKEAIDYCLNYERKTLPAMIAACNSAQAAAKKVAQNPRRTTAELVAAENELSRHLHEFRREYAKLSNSKMQLELSATEAKISSARRAYNDAVKLYNQFATTFGIRSATLWETYQSHSISMKCPNCGSESWKFAHLVYREGITHVESSNTGVGIGTHGGNIGYGVGVGGASGTHQTEMSKRASPPSGFEVDTAWFIASMCSLLIAWIVPADTEYAVAEWGVFLFFVFLVLTLLTTANSSRKRAERHAEWAKTKICQRCGTSFY